MGVTKTVLTAKDFKRIHEEARAAGLAAVTPDVKGETVKLVSSDLFDKPIPGAQTFIMDDFPCGFAWISFKGNTAWGKWAKAEGLARPDYPKGMSIWVHDFNQSMTKKEVYAQAYAKVLRDNGIEAYAQSRMD